jgi:hypothetical protein
MLPNPIQALFELPFRDRNWQQKFLIGAAIAFASFIVPIVPLLFVAGFAHAFMRQVILEEEPHLPDWSQAGSYLLGGLKIWLVGIVYGLPVILLILAGYAAFFVPTFSMVLIADYESTFPPALILLQMIGWAAGMGLFGVAMLFSLVAGVFAPVSIAHMAAKDELAAAFRVRQWWPVLRANLGGFALAYTIVLGAAMMLWLVYGVLYLSIVLCVLIPFALSAMTYLTTVWSAGMTAQAYRRGVEQLANKETPHGSKTSGTQEPPG